jgi:NFU1 iron-sulfur cluster scaffold homolog, mitochondrial
MIMMATTMKPTVQRYGCNASLLMRRSLFIQTMATPNPDSKKFYPGEHKVMGDGGETADFPDMRSAYASPLALELFKLDGIKQVYFGSDFVSIQKSEDQEWPDVEPSVFSVIAEFYASGEPLLSGELAPDDTAPHEDDDEVVAMIKELLDTRIRPQLQEDGGDLRFLKFDEGIVYLKMQGSCSGCPSAGATVKGGIERMLMHWIPEVQGCVEVDEDDLSVLNQQVFASVSRELEAQKAQESVKEADQRVQQ